ncbi:MAG: virulence-associated E family protein [Pseudomonadota bacterium]
MTEAHTFKIATGTNRGRSKNDIWSARKLWRKLETPLLDTEISYAKWLNLDSESKTDNDLKARLKAKAGWFKLGHYKDGRRKLDHLLFVSAISLDLDNISPDQVEALLGGSSPICRYSFFAHTTRSHMPEKPRWRLIVFLSRDVDLDEANALARFLACRLDDDPTVGIEIPDQVSFRNNQISYWPSICEGQEYRLEKNVGEILDVDAFLGEHDGWEDISRLPMQDHETSAAGSRPGKRFEDPHEKPGVIGAFCRAYDAETAIAEFLSDVYAPSDQEVGRYTYLLGSGNNGVIIYDEGQILYSNHGTDPIQGGANVFDAVRIHKFGHLDVKKDEDESPMRLPSFRAMSEWAAKLGPVKAEMAEALGGRFDEDADETDDFLGLGDEAEDTRFDADEDEIEDFLGLGSEAPATKKRKWKKELRLNAETGTLVKTIHNVKLILVNDKPFDGLIGYNEFTHGIVARRPLDLPKLELARIPVLDPTNGREWQDADEHDVRSMLAAPQDLGGWEYDVSLVDISTAVEIAARQNTFHPLLDRLTALAWDGAERAETLFIRYLGVEDSPYHRETCRKWLLAAVTRLFEPGHKFEYVPVLGGAQGIGKSTFVRDLALGFFGELSHDINNLGRMVESMLGFWILEIGEMAGFSKAEVEETKKFIASQKDTVRLAYRRNAETFARQCVFMATTNRDQFLKDETGNRRYWPIKVAIDHIDLKALRAEIEQVWAEVVVWYRDARKKQPHGELPLFLQDKAAQLTSARLQDQSRTLSPSEMMAEKIAPWLERERDLADVVEGGDDRFDRESAGDGVRVRRNRVLASTVWEDCLGHDRAPSNLDLQNLAAATNHIDGWTKDRRSFDGYRTTWFLRENADLETEWEPVG